MVTWEAVGRRPHPFTRLYMFGMWMMRDKLAFEGERRTLDKARRRQRQGNAAPTRWTRLITRVVESEVADMTVWTAHPRQDAPVVRVVYVHGGGYVHPLTRDYWRLIRALVRTPAEVVVPAYPLAPDASVDDVLPRLIQLVREADGPDVPTVLMGDSAGGALVLAMARELTDDDGGRVAGVVCLSPWLDAELEQAEVQDLEASDPMLAESGLRAAARWWAGPHAPSDPAISPVHLELDGLPPIDVFIGDHDILRPAVDSFTDRAGAADLEVHVHEHPGMFHVWMTRAIPEARRTRHRLRELLRERSGVGRQTGPMAVRGTGRPCA